MTKAMKAEAPLVVRRISASELTLMRDWSEAEGWNPARAIISRSRRPIRKDSSLAKSTVSQSHASRVSATDRTSASSVSTLCVHDSVAVVMAWKFGDVGLAHLAGRTSDSRG